MVHEQLAFLLQKLLEPLSLRLVQEASNQRDDQRFSAAVKRAFWRYFRLPEVVQSVVREILMQLGVGA